jgi:hydrogenase nickel incorporation protein HypA/HybF
MHELSIASAILDRANAESLQNTGARVIKVGLRVGELAGVDPEALSFAFEALCKATPWEGATLEIEFCRHKRRCSLCNVEFTPGELSSRCPTCQQDDSLCVAGKELDVTFIELEDPPCA